MKWFNPENPTKAFRIVKWAVLTLFGIFSVAVLYTAYENWSGAREWKRVEARLLEEGVNLQPEAFEMEARPAEANFGQDPLIASLNHYEIEETSGEIRYHSPGLVQEIQRLSLPKDGSSGTFLPSWSEQRDLDLGKLAATMSSGGGDAEAVLQWMKDFAPTLARIDRAARKAEVSYFPLILEEDFPEIATSSIPWASHLRQLYVFYAARVGASLESGDADAAGAGLVAMKRIRGLYASHPHLLTRLFEFSLREIELSIFWHGIQQNLWSSEMLAWISSEMLADPESPFDDLERSISFELGFFMIGAMDYLKTNPASLEGFGEEVLNRKYLGVLPISMAPDGIWDHNKASGVATALDYCIIPLRQRKLASVEGNHSNRFDAHKVFSSRRFMVELSTLQYLRMVDRAFDTATAIQLARTSVALELFQSESGNYPTKLEELVPAYLRSVPVDYFDNDHGAVRYRKTENGYDLFSVGRDGIDDDGKLEYKGSGKSRGIDRDRGDLVWSVFPERIGKNPQLQPQEGRL